MEDNWSKYGFSSTMGPKLRKLVQNQLADEVNTRVFSVMTRQNIIGSM